MTIREQLERQEQTSLSAHACLSGHGGKRKKPEDPCAVRTAFQHDRDRILHCKSFRRLKHKTQVFLAPEGDHYRTRLTHTLEVAQIARTVSKALRLNEDLTEAIALGHDLGHTPFGHAGEKVLSELVTGGFHHVLQSLRVVDCLEKEGQGLNLTEEVRDGIVKHSKGRGPILAKDPAVRAQTLEGQIVRLADIVAYVNHDLDDALRAGLIHKGQVPAAIVDVLGCSHSQRINTMVCDMIQASLCIDGGGISLSPAVVEAIDALREWLFVHVYQVRTVHDDFIKASRILRELFLFFMQNEEALVAHGGDRFCGDPLEISVADFIAGMTDRFAINLYHRLFLPQPWKIL
ncbi:deoxyguanosinetriphosphate triphosphohydrolase [Desulfuromonas sp. AOP6]|uniref:deoxyguanosinetriphosphate triphosphohydrolase n=1 Tax=Desulfuromonas sp. AOP6 TaxID=1566351 RepID=UPI0012755E19|nr:deoxyguanosinetriphosphate triphosphohydrolase [Desulfuromonas sp. AOP6]BCA80274.1 deoxyguanosinetriphosphatetriphosphohydrolase-like protein [Desulfuromonas sp. AOP6]